MMILLPAVKKAAQILPIGLILMKVPIQTLCKL